MSPERADEAWQLPQFVQAEAQIGVSTDHPLVERVRGARLELVPVEGLAASKAALSSAGTSWYPEVSRNDSVVCRVSSPFSEYIRSVSALIVLVVLIASVPSAASNCVVSCSSPLSFVEPLSSKTNVHEPTRAARSTANASVGPSAARVGKSTDPGGWRAAPRP